MATAQPDASERIRCVMRLEDGARAKISIHRLSQRVYRLSLEWKLKKLLHSSSAPSHTALPRSFVFFHLFSTHDTTRRGCSLSGPCYASRGKREARETERRCERRLRLYIFWFWFFLQISVEESARASFFSDPPTKMTSVEGETATAVPDPPAVDPAVPPPPQSTPAATRMIGQWQVEKQIGRGSFAVVWRARHATSRVKVAIKEIKLEKLNRKLRESLESEISVLQRSKHDNIIKLHEIIKVRAVQTRWKRRAADLPSVRSFFGPPLPLLAKESEKTLLAVKK